MIERHDTVIVGGGQAGLAMSRHLSDRGREHVILERRRIGERWRSERWNSLYFQFPNWSVRLPGMSYAGGEPDAFCHHGEIIRFIDAYAAKINAPVRENTEVTSLRQNSETGRYIIKTSTAVIEADRVVIATGPFQRPMIPHFSRNVSSSIYQIDAAKYRSPDELPPGAVLVVGSGASGCQIADELNQSGRQVFLAVSRHRRLPRRYRGKDVFWWTERLGRFDMAIDTFPGRKYPPSSVVTGVNGGYDVDARRFAADGMKILGHVQGISDDELTLDPNANQILGEADAAYSDFISAAEKLIDQSDLRSSLGADDSRPPAPNPERIDDVERLRFRTANIQAIVWATGHRFDFGWVQLPIFDSNGAPIQQRGVTGCRGVYFLGLHWMHSFKSGLLPFVGEDAEYLADHMDSVPPA